MTKVRNWSPSKVASVLELFLPKVEGLELTAYQDGGGVWTIGVGHTGPSVHGGMTITHEEALSLLDVDMHAAIRAVAELVLVPLSVNEAAALVSFTFNLGRHAFETSTLLKRLNAGKYGDIPAQLRRWVYDNHKKVEGLVNRREAEIKLWSSP